MTGGFGLIVYLIRSNVYGTRYNLDWISNTLCMETSTFILHSWVEFGIMKDKSGIIKYLF